MPRSYGNLRPLGSHGEHPSTQADPSTSSFCAPCRSAVRVDGAKYWVTRVGTNVPHQLPSYQRLNSIWTILVMMPSAGLDAALYRPGGPSIFWLVDPRSILASGECKGGHWQITLPRQQCWWEWHQNACDSSNDARQPYDG
jgi:hypothetical protein